MLLHVGRIEETDDGAVATKKCGRCEEEELESCIMYDEAARTKYHVTGVGYSCSRSKATVASLQRENANLR